jgi:hypothetical protein
MSDRAESEALCVCGETFADFASFFDHLAAGHVTDEAGDG